MKPMNNGSAAILAIMLLALAGGAASASEDIPGDAVLGHNLALKVCQQCHHVEAGEREGKLPDPPAFQNLADDTAMTPMALSVFLTTPHSNMPNLILTDAEVDNIIAYIESLKGK
jgi:mono/diheme cytochrome c family protein